MSNQTACIGALSPQNPEPLTGQLLHITGHETFEPRNIS